MWLRSKLFLPLSRAVVAKQPKAPLIEMLTFASVPAYGHHPQAVGQTRMPYTLAITDIWQSFKEHLHQHRLRCAEESYVHRRDVKPSFHCLSTEHILQANPEEKTFSALVLSSTH
jgi:hypothetical protein